jgi:hypothetical protein
LPGERAPDAPIQHATGTPTRLFELFQGPHWTVLGHTIDRNTNPPHPALHVHVFGAHGDVVDAHGLATAAYALTPGHGVLVRPDGYIGAVFAADRPDRLRTYLQRVGLCG